VLVASFEPAYVRGADDVHRLAASMRLFENAHAVSTGHVCHLVRIAHALESAMREGYEYACFYGMSVGDDPWRVRARAVSEGDGDDVEYDHRRYNFTTDGAILFNPETSQWDRAPIRYRMADPGGAAWVTHADVLFDHA
jgi:hypothetical protein